VASLFQNNVGSRAAGEIQTPRALDVHTQRPINKTAEEFYESGKYRECSDLLDSRFKRLQIREIKLLAYCSYSSEAYQNVFAAAEKLVVNPSSEAEGLFWETRSVQK